LTARADVPSGGIVLSCKDFSLNSPYEEFSNAVVCASLDGPVYEAVKVGQLKDSSLPENFIKIVVGQK
jgi:hypothetical protein